MSEYDKLQQAYSRMRLQPSTATVLRPFPVVREELGLKKPPKERPAPEVTTDIDRLLEPFVQKMEAGRDSLLNHLSLQGLPLKRTVDIREEVSAVGAAMEAYITDALSLDTLMGRNRTTPSDYLSRLSKQLETVQDLYTRCLDDFMNYTLDISANMEKDSSMQELQMQELIAATLIPTLAQNAGIDIQPLTSKGAPSKRRDPRAGVAEQRVAPSITRRTPRSSVLRAVKDTTVPILQTAFYKFRSIPISIQQVTQIHSQFLQSMSYFRLLSDTTPPIQSVDLTVRSRAARSALSKLQLEDQDVFDLRSQQLIESNSLWQYMLRRLSDFIAEVLQQQRILPALSAMIIQSSTGMLIGYVNDLNLVQKATSRAEEGEAAQLSAIERMQSEMERERALQAFEGEEGLAERRSALFSLYNQTATTQLNALSFSSYVEKLRRLDDRSSQDTNLLIAFDTLRRTTNEMLKRVQNLAIPFYDRQDRRRIIDADRTLELKNKAFYEQNMEKLNDLAAIYPGSLEPVTKITEGIACVRSDSICENVDSEEDLPGAAEFLEANVKLLQEMTSPEEVTNVIAEARSQGTEIDLWENSRDAATAVLYNVSADSLDLVPALEVLGIKQLRDTIKSGDPNFIELAKSSNPEGFKIAKMSFLSESIKASTEELIRDSSLPISTEALRARAQELNQDAAWESLGRLLTTGSNNTVMNNLLLSIIASISKAVLGANVSTLVNFSQTFAENVLPNILQWIPRMSSAVIQYGLVNHMLSLAIANAVVGFTNAAEEWDAFLDEAVGRSQGVLSGTLRTLYSSFMTALRAVGRVSIQASSYVNRNAQLGWIVFAALIGLQGLGSAVWEVGARSVAAGTLQTVIQSGGFILLAGTEGALHTLLYRYMTRFTEERKAALSQAEAAIAAAERRITAIQSSRTRPTRRKQEQIQEQRTIIEQQRAAVAAAQTAIYWSPVRWALWGSSITVFINFARLLLRNNTSLWNNLFEQTFSEEALRVNTTLESPTLLEFAKNLETTLLANADYSSRYAYNSAVSAAVVAAAGKT